MALVIIVDGTIKVRIVYQATRMLSLFVPDLHSRSNTLTVPLIAFLTFGTRLVRPVFLLAHTLV